MENGESPSRVGSVRRVSYRDGTVQLLKLSALNDSTRALTWDIYMSEPPVQYSSAVHTLRLRRVTVGNQTVIELLSDYSKDASLEVIEDSKYKKLEFIKALRVAASAKAKPYPLEDFGRRADDAERVIRDLTARLERLEQRSAAEVKGDSFLLQLTGSIFSGKGDAFLRNSQEFSESVRRIRGISYYAASLLSKDKVLVSVLFRDSHAIIEFVSRQERRSHLENSAVLDGGFHGVMFGNPSKPARDALKAFNTNYFDQRGFSRA